MSASTAAAAAFTHSEDSGPIDYTVSNSTVHLGSDPMVIFDGESHPLATFTPFAPWVITYDATDTDKAIAVSIPQSWWDLWFLSAGQATDWLRDLDDVLPVSVTPASGSDMWDALVGPGGLVLTNPCANLEEFLGVVELAKRECLKARDTRLQLAESSCFLSQKYTGSQQHAYGAKMSGTALLVAEDTSPMAKLGFVLRPRNLVKDRCDASGSYVRVLEVLRLITSQRSLTIKEIVASPSRVNASEIAELVADTWLLVNAGSDVVISEERAVKRILDLDRVAAAVFGNQDQREANFTKNFRSMVTQCPILESVIDIDFDSEALAMSRMELLAVKELPAGAKWKSKTCMIALEVILKGWEMKINTHLLLRGTERLVAIMQDLKHSKAFFTSDGGVERGNDRKDDLGVNGREAIRSASFLQARAILEPLLAVEEPNILLLFDAMLESDSKVWYMIAMSLLKKKTHDSVVQDCSQFLSEFGRYWTMTMSMRNGTVHEDVMDKVWGDDDVTKLLTSGKWDEISWCGLSDELALWMHGEARNSTADPYCFESLKRAEVILLKTFKMLQLDTRIEQAHRSTSGGSSRGSASNNTQLTQAAASRQSLSFSELYERIVDLQSKCQVAPPGTNIRKSMERGVKEVFQLMLKNAGDRWKRQFSGEVNLLAPLSKCFLTTSSPVLRELEKREEVALQMHKFSETLPVVFEGMAGMQTHDMEEDNDIPAVQLQRKNPPIGGDSLDLW